MVTIAKGGLLYRSSKQLPSMAHLTSPAAIAHPPVVGKSRRDEDYPFGSLLLAPDMRPHVAAFYLFARHADDIADDPDMDRDVKLRRLDALETVLDGGAATDEETRPALRLRESLHATGIDDRPARDLLAAFRWDAKGGECADWTDLLAYCRQSAVPVGRFLLALHGEGPASVPAADALCSAVQILNHVQDARTDYRRLGRVYLPCEWMRQVGVEPEVLGRSVCTAPLRACIDRVLGGARDLLATAEDLPRNLRNGRLRAEAAVIIELANRLERRLRSSDPLSRRVSPTPFDYAFSVSAGLWRAVVRR